jgi:hypothetical protein
VSRGPLRQTEKEREGALFCLSLSTEPAPTNRRKEPHYQMVYYYYPNTPQPAIYNIIYTRIVFTLPFPSPHALFHYRPFDCCCCGCCCVCCWKKESRVEVVLPPAGAKWEEEEGGKGDCTRSSSASFTARSSRVLGRGAGSATCLDLGFLGRGFGVVGWLLFRVDWLFFC